jgi:hypothetical protein
MIQWNSVGNDFPLRRPQQTITNGAPLANARRSNP